MSVAPIDDDLARVGPGTMTIVYGGMRWYLDPQTVRVHPAGEEPRTVAVDALPLPVARVLGKLRLAPDA